MNTRWLEHAVFRMLPAAVLLVSFAGICIQTGTLWPWDHVVHEDGVRTLLGTLFFVEHATRELLPDLLLALAVAGAVRYFYPPCRATPSRAATVTRARRRLAFVAAATLVAIVGGTLWIGGLEAVLDNISQSHTRAGAPLVWGAHWRYHLIERFAQILLAFATTGVLWMLNGCSDARSGRGPLRYYASALAVFAILALVFDPTTEPFREPTFLGHQLRELFTHALVTLPLALGVCLNLARQVSPPLDRRRSRSPVWPIVAAGAVSVISGAFLLVASLLTGAQSHGQTTGLASLLFPHFAEHGLGYILVPAVAGLLYLWPASVFDDIALE